MSLVASGLTLSGKTKFGNRCMKLAVTLAVTAASVDLALAKVKSSTIKLTSTAPTGDENIIQKSSLQDILEMAAANEGSIRVTSNGDNSVHTVKGTIELSDDGAITATTDQEFIIDYVLTAGVVATFNTLDIDKDAVTKLTYVFARVSKDIITPMSTKGCKFVAIPRADAVGLVSVEFYHKSGRRVKYTPAELEQLLSEANPVSYEINGLITSGCKELLIWNTSKIDAVAVEQTTDGNIYKMLDSLI